MLRNLFLGHPLKVLQILLILQQVRLPSHDPALHEECLLAQELRAGLLVLFRMPEIVNVVADWMVAHHPGIHVHASRLRKGPFSSLSRRILARYWPKDPDDLPLGDSLPPEQESWGTSSNPR